MSSCVRSFDIDRKDRERYNKFTKKVLHRAVPFSVSWSYVLLSLCRKGFEESQQWRDADWIQSLVLHTLAHLRRLSRFPWPTLMENIRRKTLLHSRYMVVTLRPHLHTRFEALFNSPWNRCLTILSVLYGRHGAIWWLCLSLRLANHLISARPPCFGKTEGFSINSPSLILTTWTCFLSHRLHVIVVPCGEALKQLITIMS